MVSNANAVRNLLAHGFAADLADAGARAVNVGLDMEMAMLDPAYVHCPRRRSGAVSEEVIDARTSPRTPYVATHPVCAGCARTRGVRQNPRGA